MRALLVSISIALGLLLCCSAARPAVADGCVQSVRTVKFPDGSARVKSYVCTLGKAKKPQIRVEFYRLSVLAAGSLVHGTPNPDLERMFGTPQLVDNAVGAEVKLLFDQFGSKSEAESCYTTQIASAGQAEPFTSAQGYAGENETEECQIRRTVWHLDFEGDTEMPLAADASHVLKEKDWPDGYNFFYWENGACSKDTPIECATLWRTATPADIEDYDARYQAYLASHATDDAGETSDGSIDDKESRPELALITYLMRDGWVDDFLLVTGSLGQCGDDLAFAFYLGERDLALDIAVVTNIAASPIAVDSLLGNVLTDGRLRTEAVATAAENAAPRAEPIATTRTLKPGEALAVPLKLSFTTDTEAFKEKKAAEKIYGWIKKAPPGKPFSATSEDGTGPPVLKVRESFGPPSAPPQASYVYGPEFILKGIGIDGQTIDFKEASRNLLTLSDDPGFGSCPYLYAWDDRDGVWVSRGKVIDEAHGKSKETTQRISFDGFRSKFRLAEEELELSYIDSAVLEVELVGGGGMTLRSALRTLGERDGSYAEIYAHENITFDFALPPNIKAEDVKRSTLAITGYYRRYSSLLMARQ